MLGFAARQLPGSASCHFPLESNQLILIIAHMQGLHVFKLVQPASGLKEIGDILYSPCQEKN
jgi:hypothetical protein